VACASEFLWYKVLLLQILKKDDCRGSTKVKKEESGRYPQKGEQALKLYCAHGASNKASQLADDQNSRCNLEAKQLIHGMMAQVVKLCDAGGLFRVFFLSPPGYPVGYFIGGTKCTVGFQCLLFLSRIPTTFLSFQFSYFYSLHCFFSLLFSLVESEKGVFKFVIPFYQI